MRHRTCEGCLWITSARASELRQSFRMGARTQIPEELGTAFRVREALAAGVGQGRLRGPDLDRPFRGIRALARAQPEEAGPWNERRAELVWLAEAYAPLLGPDQFFSHETAIAIWGGPLPASRGREMLDVSVTGTGSIPRGRGVRGHRAQPAATSTRVVRGLRTASFATMWASMGAAMTRNELVALGDFGCRTWRNGVNRPDPGKPPLTTPAQLEAAATAGRRRGAATLRESLPLIRLDAWSPRETMTRLAIIDVGLPEPQLNLDVLDPHGGFLACLDLAYPELKVAIEYHGQLHGAQYAADIERIERLRADGWIVIQVTSDTIRYPNIVARRVRAALLERGWMPDPR